MGSNGQAVFNFKFTVQWAVRVTGKYQPMPKMALPETAGRDTRNPKE